MKKIILLIILTSLTSMHSQDSPAKKEEKPKNAPPAFIDANLIHMPSTQPLQKDILNFIFNHRFGNANSTLYDFLGFRLSIFEINKKV